MGWLSGLWGSSSSSGAVDTLDSDLRDFLEKGNQQQTPSTTSSAPSNSRTAPSRSPAPSSESTTATQDDRSYWDDYRFGSKADDKFKADIEARARRDISTLNTKPSQPVPSSQTSSDIPKESLYQDGRYADLWKTYVPTSSMDAPSNDQEMIGRLADTIRDAKKAIDKSAAENCIDEKFAVVECGDRGAWAGRFMMCRTERKQLNRCLEMQQKFLRALGYQSLYTRAGRGQLMQPTKLDERGVEVERSWDDLRGLEQLEKIQLHADKLYREMVAREKEMMEAKERGEDYASPSQPVMAKERVDGLRAQTGMNLKEIMEHMPEKPKAQLTKRLESLNGEQLALEERVIESELKDRAEGQVILAMAMKEERRARLQRKREGRETVGDKLKHMGGWSQEEDDG